MVHRTGSPGSLATHTFSASGFAPDSALSGLYLCLCRLHVSSHSLHACLFLSPLLRVRCFFAPSSPVLNTRSPRVHATSPSLLHACRFGHTHLRLPRFAVPLSYHTALPRSTYTSLSARFCLHCAWDHLSSHATSHLPGSAVPWRVAVHHALPLLSAGLCRLILCTLVLCRPGCHLHATATFTSRASHVLTCAICPHHATSPHLSLVPLDFTGFTLGFLSLFSSCTTFTASLLGSLRDSLHLRRCGSLDPLFLTFCGHGSLTDLTLFAFGFLPPPPQCSTLLPFHLCVYRSLRSCICTVRSSASARLRTLVCTCGCGSLWFAGSPRIPADFYLSPFLFFLLRCRVLHLRFTSGFTYPPPRLGSTPFLRRCTPLGLCTLTLGCLTPLFTRPRLPGSLFFSLFRLSPAPLPFWDAWVSGFHTASHVLLHVSPAHTHWSGFLCLSFSLVPGLPTLCLTTYHATFSPAWFTFHLTWIWVTPTSRSSAPHLSLLHLFSSAHLSLYHRLRIHIATTRISFSLSCVHAHSPLPFGTARGSCRTSRLQFYTSFFLVHRSVHHLHVHPLTHHRLHTLTFCCLSFLHVSCTFSLGSLSSPLSAWFMTFRSFRCRFLPHTDLRFLTAPFSLLRFRSLPFSHRRVCIGLFWIAWVLHLSAFLTFTFSFRSCVSVPAFCCLTDLTSLRTLVLPLLDSLHHLFFGSLTFHHSLWFTPARSHCHAYLSAHCTSFTFLPFTGILLFPPLPLPACLTLSGISLGFFTHWTHVWDFWDISATPFCCSCACTATCLPAWDLTLWFYSGSRTAR